MHTTSGWPTHKPSWVPIHAQRPGSTANLLAGVHKPGQKGYRGVYTLDPPPAGLLIRGGSEGLKGHFSPCGRERQFVLPMSLSRFPKTRY